MAVGKLAVMLIALIILFSIEFTFGDDSSTFAFASHNDNYNNNFTGIVTQVIDGYTLEVDEKRIKLALVESIGEEERGKDRDSSLKEATHFTSILCPIRSPSIVEPDYNNSSNKNSNSSPKTVHAVVYCLSNAEDKAAITSVNEALLESKLAIIDRNLCSKSEFATEEWAQRFGC